jgi:hypothetical protein
VNPRLFNAYRYYIVIFISSVFLIGWVWFFQSTTPNSFGDNASSYDNVSGETVPLEALKDTTVINPNVPYLVGFNKLIENGVLRGDVSYISDVIINFTLYERKIKFGKVSFVKDSYKPEISKGVSSKYSFKFAINDGSGGFYTLVSESNIVDSSIDIVIYNDSNKKVFSKSFIQNAIN